MDEDYQRETSNSINMLKLFSLIVILMVTSVLFIELRDRVDIGRLNEFANVEINKQIIKVDVADEIEEQIKGLSDRLILEKGTGMLFVFDNKQERSFWMKRMNFPIDIIWIDDDRVVNIHKNLAPEGAEPKNHYNSQFSVNRVLEVNAGFADEQKIKIGDLVQINLKKN